MGLTIFGCKRRADRTGVLLAQLGTPDAPTARALRPYLRQFLSDPRVIEKNRFVWWLVLNGIVLPLRPKRSARLYSRIWGKEGSPLLVLTRAQHRLLAERLTALDPELRVALGMRYGTPSLESALDELVEAGCRRIVLVPLYPQYSATTTASTYDAVFRRLLEERWVPALKVVEPYHTHPAYLEALAVRVNEYLAGCDRHPERIVLSYHGIPAAYVERGDPYCCMCTETTRALLPLLRFDPQRVIHTFQSRFGRDPWLEPYTDVTIERLAKEGVRHIALFAPGFTADCLETLDELGNEGSHLFKEHGGERFDLISCLNDHPRWIEALEAITRECAGTWVSSERRETPRFGCPAKIAARG